MGTTYSEFLSALRMRESSGNYQIVNSYGFLGAYQFGEAALVDLGFVNLDSDPYDNVFSAGFTGRLGINSAQDFLNSPSAQDAAADDWFPLIWRYAVARGLDDYLGQTIAGIQITASGILAGSHLLGSGAVGRFLSSGGTYNPADAYGTPISEYISMFSGYQMPFDTGEVLVSNTQPTTGDDGVIRGSITDDELTGGDGDDSIAADAGDDIVIAMDGNDVVHGDEGNDNISGGNGDDRVYGDAGGDVINAGSGNDEVYGGDGDDVIYGGEHGEELAMAQAGDSFVFRSEVNPKSAAELVDEAESQRMASAHHADLWPVEPIVYNDEPSEWTAQFISDAIAAEGQGALFY